MAVWMCFKKYLFCYPCLLFSTSDNVWIKTGFCDLKNLPRSLSKFATLQNKLLDIAFCCAQIRDTIDYVERQRQEFDSFYHRFEQKCGTLDLTDTGDMRQIKDKRKQTFYNILDDIIVHLKSRFENFSELSFLSLVDCSKFSEMAQEFDNTKLQSLSEKYAKFFDCVNLRQISLDSTAHNRLEMNVKLQ